MSSYKDWIRKIDIEVDYFSAYIKAWIAFNAWYRSEFSERTDREIIEKLKTQHNRLKAYIETLLDKNNTSEEATLFNDNLKKLQTTLTQAAICTQERSGVNQQISFAQIAITNPKTNATYDYRTTHYQITRTNKKISTVVHKKGDSSHILFQFEQDGYDEVELTTHLDFKKLNAEQQGQCRAFYREINPFIIESVVKKDKDNNIIFVEERAKVSLGIIEVLYLLRCSLMHGEVNPDNASMEVYKYAYFVLSVILKKLL